MRWREKEIRRGREKEKGESEGGKGIGGRRCDREEKEGEKERGRGRDPAMLEEENKDRNS